MTYQERKQRSVIENDGNIGLFVDDRQRFYTLIEGEKVFFTGYGNYVYINPDIDTGRSWWGSHSWDWYAVEKVDDYIKVITRSWAKPENAFEKKSNDYETALLFEVVNYTLEGKFFSADYPPGKSQLAHSWAIPSESDYIKKFAYRLTSPLEKWALNDESILKEFQDLYSYPFSKIDRDTLLEDWAYKKYVELYPGEKVPSTYGIEGNYPSGDNAYFGRKTLTGNFRDYKFYNRGSGKYEIKTDSGFDEITGMTLEFADQNIDAVDDVKGVFDQITGLNTDSGKMFRLYNAAFARFPDASGLKYWIANFSSGKDDERAVASSFLASSEFKERYGDNVSNAKYVETLYVNVLGRDYDQSGYNYWLGNLNNGLEKRHELLLGFAEAGENKVLFSEMTGFV